jgi:adenosyl cobinamide kinase/adenosyl cobinamide phosphate guanylyltransferase
MDPLSPSELVLVLGGQRSGKSERAEALAATGAPPVTYVATIRDSADAELKTRVARHKSRRDPTWITVLATDDLDLPAAGTVLIDGLGAWLAGLVEPAEPARVVERMRRSGPTVVVSEEVGMGVVPLTEEGRSFADNLGALNQAVANAADRVYLIVAGRALSL